MPRRHPVLKNVYDNLRPNDSVLFLDESYSLPLAQRQSFYIVAGVLLEKQVLIATRDDIRKIVGVSRWHTTEALQNETTGIPTVEKLLDYCSGYSDPTFIAYKSPLTSDDDIEHARQICLTELLKHTNNRMSAVVIEARQHQKDNDADRTLIKQLRKAGDVDRSTAAIHASPTDEQLLWLPDLVAMMYRRYITHTNETGKYFSKYLAESTTVIGLGSQNLPGTSLVAKIADDSARSPKADSAIANSKLHVLDESCQNKDFGFEGIDLTN